MLDPSIWEDPDIGSLSIPERLLFIGMLSHADDEGLGDADARVLKRAVFGFDVEITDLMVDGWIENIGKRIRGVLLYRHESRRFYYLSNWKKYQKVSHPSPTRFPLPPNLDGSQLPMSEREKVGYKQVVTKWEQATGTITSAIADELFAMMEDWETHADKLPDEHPDKLLKASDVVIEAIAEGVRSAKTTINVNYVKAILKSWMQNGYKYKRENTGKTILAKPVLKSLSPEDVKKARKKK